MLPVWWDDIKHFKPSEFDSPDAPGSGAENMEEDFVRKLDELRRRFGKPLSVQSGYRTKEYTDKKGWSQGSRHRLGLAADLRCWNPQDKYDIQKIAYELGFHGIGVYDGHVHVDGRPDNERASWPGKSQ